MKVETSWLFCTGFSCAGVRSVSTTKFENTTSSFVLRKFLFFEGAVEATFAVKKNSTLKVQQTHFFENTRDPFVFALMAKSLQRQVMYLWFRGFVLTVRVRVRSNYKALSGLRWKEGRINFLRKHVISSYSLDKGTTQKRYFWTW